MDEFQDINPLDLELPQRSGSRQPVELPIVGDDDQAIFEWRGATPEFILEPDRHRPGYQTHILEVNYRSPEHRRDVTAAD